MYNTSQCSRGIPNKSDSEQKQDNFYYSSPKAATDMGVSSSESQDLTAFYEMLSASFGVLSQNTGFYPSLDRIIETTLGPLNLGPGGGSYNEPISRLQCLQPLQPGPIIINDQEEYEVKEVLDSRFRWGKLWYLVKFIGWSHSDNMWLPHLKVHVPAVVEEFHLRHPDPPCSSSPSTLTTSRCPRH